MALDLSALRSGFDRYVHAVLDPELSGEERRIDLKHMRFWYPYYADVVTDVAELRKPRVEKRTLKVINSQSQIDYEPYANGQIVADLKAAQETILLNLPRVPPDQHIPYKKGSQYFPEQYAAVLVVHLRMHWEYLEKLARKKE
ncbi:hypothetical protein LIX60_05190 [Streptomyces sp. S07_1.15]|uniref:hypothetical protein n=1 Tax=Streptomyces sp. S07_1.15 TaxID=2873925 RepID=UPI001D13BFBF|nr:hypothetical protein [Streptomyces sp. S07_1.15]MCC3650880.1 hypothetical protein [Streptomyces sp. S07_1.15]